ncbi:DUF1232 domain-containing protein (plasmid) [Kovacikia minuta CCNUW1]|uniref:YkvA family protein n=1 Tax=Kovacikia minuta TaxID=2931930 RepID=UPI001CCD05AE|nr:DUF1232 domain-containing protein [Kovacikia minuta]UBF30541.1 DUF1232 domain-containing protein [Kovacikia minuta CCNUW1]
MIHRTLSGQAIGSTKPRSQVIDPGCWHPKEPPERSHHPSFQTPNLPAVNPPYGAQLGHYQLESLPSFPRTLFEFRKYDGAKALTAILLFLATVYFLFGFLGFLCDHTPWLKQLFQSSATIKTVPPTAWWQIWKPIGATVNHIASYVDLAFRLFVFLCTYCIAWATFDPRNIEGYVMGFFNTCLGLAYMLSPIDAIPDFVPVAGSLDDAVLGVGVLLLGLSSLYRNKLRDVKTKTILELIDDGNSQKALQMLLEDKGVRIKDKESQAATEK